LPASEHDQILRLLLGALHYTLPAPAKCDRVSRADPLDGGLFGYEPKFFVRLGQHVLLSFRRFLQNPLRSRIEIESRQEMDRRSGSFRDIDSPPAGKIGGSRNVGVGHPIAVGQVDSDKHFTKQRHTRDLPLRKKAPSGFPLGAILSHSVRWHKAT